MSMNEDKIILEGMAFYGYHGAREEEKRLGQRFVVDVELYADLSRAGKSDRLEDTVDYGDAFKIIRAIMEGPSKDLLEALAEEIAANLLASLAADAVRVRVKKPGVPIKGSVLAHAAVEVFRKREGA